MSPSLLGYAFLVAVSTGAAWMSLASEDSGLVPIDQTLCTYGDEHRLIVAIDEALRDARLPPVPRSVPFDDLKTLLGSYQVETILEEDGNGHEYLKVYYQRNISGLVWIIKPVTGLGFTKPVPRDASDALYSKGFLIRIGSYDTLSKLLHRLATALGEPGHAPAVALAPSAHAIVVTDTAPRLRAWEALIRALDPR